MPIWFVMCSQEREDPNFSNCDLSSARIEMMRSAMAWFRGVGPEICAVWTSSENAQGWTSGKGNLIRDICNSDNLRASKEQSQPPRVGLVGLHLYSFSLGEPCLGPISRTFSSPSWGIGSLVLTRARHLILEPRLESITSRCPNVRSDVLRASDHARIYPTIQAPPPNGLTTISPRPRL